MTNGKNDNKNKNFIFSIGVLFMTGFTISAMAFGYKQDYKIPEGYHYTAEPTRGTEGRETTARIDQGGTDEMTMSNKQEHGSENKRDQQSEGTAKEDVQFILDEDYQKEVAAYLWELNPDKIMMASFFQESGYRSWVRGKAGEYGICQLMPNKTNLVWINDDKRDDWRYQVEVCVDKRKAVPRKTKGLIRASYGSQAYKKYLYRFK